MKRIRVALVNDYEIVLEGLRALLRPYSPEIRPVEIAINRKPRATVDVTMFDTYGAQDGHMFSRVEALAADSSNGALLIFSFSDQPEMIDQLMHAGAKGFVSKAASGENIVQAVRDAATGGDVFLRRRAPRLEPEPALRWPGRDIGLTGRESELLALLPSGLTNKELAARLFVSENTIKSQLRHLYTKLDVNNRTQAATRAGELVGSHHGSDRAAHAG